MFFIWKYMLSQHFPPSFFYSFIKRILIVIEITWNNLHKRMMRWEYFPSKSSQYNTCPIDSASNFQMEILMGLFDCQVVNFEQSNNVTMAVKSVFFRPKRSICTPQHSERGNSTKTLLHDLLTQSMSITLGLCPLWLGFWPASINITARCYKKVYSHFHEPDQTLITTNFHVVCITSLMKLGAVWRISTLFHFLEISWWKLNTKRMRTLIPW